MTERPLLDILSSADRRLLTASGSLEQFDTDQVIFAEGATPDRLYVILVGKVRTFKGTGDHEVGLRIFGEGQSFGELALLDGSPRSASAAALEPCTLLALERSAYLSVLGQSKDLLSHVLTRLTRRVRGNEEQIFQEELARRAYHAEMEVQRHRAVLQMVAGVAHELNTPLGIANIATGMIANRLGSEQSPGSASEDVRNASELLQKNIARAHKLVQTFRSIAQTRIPEKRERVNLESLVRDSIERFRGSRVHCGLHFEVRKETSSELEWTGYPGPLTEALGHLYANTDEFAFPAGTTGTVEILLSNGHRGRKRMYTVAVRDRGAGIPPAVQGQVFDAFFTTARGKGHVGLGLAIVRNIVTGPLDGRVELTAEPGQGTTVTIHLPAVLSGGS